MDQLTINSKKPPLMRVPTKESLNHSRKERAESSRHETIEDEKLEYRASISEMSNE